jgi:hypothetical protein
MTPGHHFFSLTVSLFVPGQNYHDRPKYFTKLHGIPNRRSCFYHLGIAGNTVPRQSELFAIAFSSPGTRRLISKKPKIIGTHEYRWKYTR